MQKDCGDNLELLVDCFVEEKNNDEALHRSIDQAESKGRELRTDENLLRQEFADSPDLQAEFRMGGVEAFIVLRKREASEQQREADQAEKRRRKESEAANARV